MDWTGARGPKRGGGVSVEYKNLRRVNKGRIQGFYSFLIYRHSAFFSPGGVDPWLVFLRLLTIACLYSYLPQTLQQWSINLLGSVALLLKITVLHKEDNCLMLTAAPYCGWRSLSPVSEQHYVLKELAFTFTSPACRYHISGQCLDTTFGCMKHIG